MISIYFQIYSISCKTMTSCNLEKIFKALKEYFCVEDQTCDLPTTSNTRWHQLDH